MESIRQGMRGAAVEDVQARLERLGYSIDATERAEERFGPMTAAAVWKFRQDTNLAAGDVVDERCWKTLVFEGYKLGDRTLYLRLPNFHGSDVRTLQEALNTLGFPCGDADGQFGAHTEAAVRQFQENVGIFPDGMCFQDTFEALWHLHHVWGDESRASSRSFGFIGFARAASVLEETEIALTADDPIARNVAGRIWNLAFATSEKSGLTLLNHATDAPPTVTCVFELTCTPPNPAGGIANVSMETVHDLSVRLKAAVATTTTKPPLVRVVLPSEPDAYGRFTTKDAQALAMTLLDALCAAFDHEEDDMAN